MEGFKGFKTRRVDLVFVLLIMISITALVNVIVLQSQYSSGASEQAIATAEAYALDASEKFSGKFDYIRETTQAIATIARAASDETDLCNTLEKLNEADENRELVSLRYFRGEKEYDGYGAEITDVSKTVSDRELRNKNAVSTYGIIYDESGSKPSIACYCPVENSPVLDGLVIYYSQQVVLAVAGDLDADKLGFSELSVICSVNKFGSDLQVLSVLRDKNGEVSVNDSFLEYMTITVAGGDDKPAARISEALIGEGDATVPVSIKNENYVVIIGRSAAQDSGLFLVNVYRESVIYSEGLSLMETSIVTMALLMAVIVVFTLYYFISRHRIYAKIEALEMINPLLHCPTLLCFERDVREILNTHKVTTFAVVVSHLQHFSYLNEKYGDTASYAVLRHLRDVYKNAMTHGETYGYIDNGEFVLLLHYNAEEKLENRLLSLYSIAKKHYVGDEIPADYDIKLLYGIYKIDRAAALPVAKMVEKALKVSDLPARTDVNKVCKFYDETVRSDYMVKAEIENRMESALQTGEFRLFYQPKYNLQHDRIDGAEILVRWYNPEVKNYRSPAEFLPVFEENGFISKLDRQIYYTACENVSNWIKEGRRIYPFSVNISRVTAIQPDFLDYYIAVKRRFNIANGFITLEFTESFAYENYDYLSKVSKRLHDAGFLCSIDDFGTGYSSYNILKLLEMDEIKLDKFFLAKGSSEKNDAIISQSVIDVGKKMGMKTTQEGVETLQDLQKLRAMGCNVIQGYFFAKPMSSNDYKKFIEDFANENFVLAAEREAERNARGKNA